MPLPSLRANSNCAHCGLDLSHKKSHAKFCSRVCKGRFKSLHKTPDERLRSNQTVRDWRASHPDYRLIRSRRYRQRVYGDAYIETENMTKDRYRVARSLGYRSGLEVTVARDLEARGVKFEFEKRKVKYTKPVKEQTYTPDFELENGVIIETKGRFTTEDRQKMRYVKEQNPDLDIRILFANANNRINKGSPTTYSMWADKNGYQWANRVVPQDWIDNASRPN